MTTKVRFVFDTAAKTNGISLNDAIYHGLKFQKDLWAVSTRFRKCPVALVCDVAEMYLRIGLDLQDRKYHQFLWRSMDQTKQPDVFEFTGLVFGVNSAPFEAQFISQEDALELKDDYPLATDTVLNSAFSVESVIDENCGIKLYQELSALWEKVNMHTRKWLSNSPKVFEKITAEDRANKVDLSKEYIPSVNSFELIWITKEDQFTYHSVPIEADFNFTKRNLLRKISSLFYPLGFFAPYIKRAKVLMQNVWVSGIDWDEQLNKDCKEDAVKWFQNLE